MSVTGSLGLSADHVELAASLRDWARSLDGTAEARAVEDDPAATFPRAAVAVAEMGLAGIALPEAVGGGGGRLLDAAVALEAAADALVPGPLLGTCVAAWLLRHSELAAEVAGGKVTVGLGLRPTLSRAGDRLEGEVAVVWDAPSVSHLLLGAGERWFLVPAERAEVRPHRGTDLTRRLGVVRLSGLAATDVVEVPGVDTAAVRRTAVTLASAEAAGVARWCLRTAVSYAGVREQFGRKIGAFQAVKHLCAEMLETTEAVAATAWDAAGAADDDVAQWAFAADVAGTVALDGAVRVAQDCIQVLGGIGFTFEHDAHLYLRRAVALRSLLSGSDAFAAELATRAAAGTRRRVRVDLGEQGMALRDAVRREVATLAALDGRAQREALADTGLLAPHWPAPHGRAAGPVEQLVIDQELAAAGVTRPDLKIGAWAVPTILAHGTDEQRDRFVRPTLRGEITWCQLFSEPGAGSDLASLRTRAERVEAGPDGPGGWRLTGQKVWTSLAQEADWAICLARTDPDAPRHRGISYFLVDMRSPGLDVRPLREMTGEAMFNEVFLDGVFVPDGLVVGEVGGGWSLARTTLANERVAMAGSRLDVSVERAVALLADLRGEATTVRVGRAVALATVCTLLGVRTTLRALAGQGPGAESSVAKLLTVRNRQDASELVVDLLGETGLLDDRAAREAVHEMLLTRCLSIAGGTTQVLRNVAGERLLGLPR